MTNKKLLCCLVLSVGFVQTSAAIQTFQLHSCVEKWDEILNRYTDAREELDFGRKLLADIDGEIAAVDAKYPFLPKANSLKISEFEAEEEFDARVKRQQNADEMQKRQAMANRDAERQKLVADRAELLEAVVAQSNLVSQIACEWFAFTNMEWKSEIQLTAADLPYFNRETMSFVDIPNPFVTHSDEKRRLRFEVLGDMDSISLKFKRLKDAEYFKNALAIGETSATLVCTFTLGIPEDCVIREAWTERQERGALEKVGIGALLIGGAILVSRYDSQNTASYGSSYGSGDLWHKTIKHPAVEGKCVPVFVRERKLIIKGEKLKDMDISSVSKWEVVFQ